METNGQTKKTNGEKKMDLKNFAKIKKSGIIAINLPDDDELVRALFLKEKEELFIGTEKGIAIRLKKE